MLKTLRSLDQKLGALQAYLTNKYFVFMTDMLNARTVYETPEYQEFAMRVATDFGCFGGLYHMLVVSKKFRETMKEAVEIGQEWRRKELGL